MLIAGYAQEVSSRNTPILTGHGVDEGVYSQLIHLVGDDDEFRLVACLADALRVGPVPALGHEDVTSTQLR